MWRSLRPLAAVPVGAWVATPGSLPSRRDGSHGIGLRPSCRGQVRAEPAKASRVVENQLQRLIATARERGEGDDTELLTKMRLLEDELWQRGKVYRIVLTGGPCGGKSTVLSDLVQMLTEKNFLVFTMPEVATEMFNWSGGRMWQDFAEEGPADDETWAKLQYEMTSIQMHIEDCILQMARQSLTKRRRLPDPPRGAVILLDRGVVDNVAYCTEEAWNMVQERLGTTTARLRDRRYDHVIHLVTAANGAEAFYTLTQAEGADGSSESARHESADEARDMDLKTQQAWLGCKKHYIVSNEGKNFSQKREEVKNIIRRIVGDPVSLQQRQTRFVCDFLSRSEVKRLLRVDPEVAYVSFSDVSNTLLSDKVRLQKRAMGDKTMSYFYQDIEEDGSVVGQFEMDFWHYLKKFRASEAGHQTAVKEDLGHGGPAEERHEFKSMQEQIISFIYNETYFRSHFFVTPEGESMLVVEVESGPEEAGKKLPKWLTARGTAEELCPCMKLLATG